MPRVAAASVVLLLAGCTSDGCWDYDQSGKVILVGKACERVKAGGDVRVQIVVGCATVIG